MFGSKLQLKCRCGLVNLFQSCPICLNSSVSEDIMPPKKEREVNLRKQELEKKKDHLSTLKYVFDYNKYVYFFKKFILH